MKFTQMLLNLLEKIVFGLILKLFLDSLPFVDCDHHWPPFFDYGSYQGKVVDHHRRERVHHIYYNVALLHVCHCTYLHFS